MDCRLQQRRRACPRPAHKRTRRTSPAVLTISADAPWLAEVVELHAFFEEWFTGTDVDFDRLTDVLAPGFVLHDPAGRIHDRDAVVESVRDARATRSVNIEIRNPHLIRTDGGAVVASYEEWHTDGSVVDARTSIVVFDPDPTAPNGLVWRYLDERRVPL